MRITPMCLFAAALFAAKDPAPPGKLLLADDFEGTAIHAGWRVAKGEWKQSGGVLTGVELPADKHAAVVRRKVAYTNAVIQLRFRLDGSRQTSLSINGAGGHICRVVMRPEGFVLMKDADKKTGEKAKELARSSKPLAAGVWQDLTLTVKGESMTAKIGEATISGAHPAIAVAKADVGLPVSGTSVSYDSIRVYGLD
ncbi:MAG: hypothetical protein FJW30_26450 [Acidobacteria bacterium]|nr:hypothetical protein [Acidobacteriota bacterium]